MNYGYVSLKKEPLNLEDRSLSRAGSLIPTDCFEDKVHRSTKRPKR